MSRKGETEEDLKETLKSLKKKIRSVVREIIGDLVFWRNGSFCQILEGNQIT